MCNHYHCSFSSHKAQIFKCNIASLHFPALRTFGKTVVPSEVPRQTLSVTLFQTVSRGRSSQQRPKRQAASRTQHRVNPSIPRRHTKYKSGPIVSNRARLRETSDAEASLHRRITSQYEPTGPQAYSNNPTPLLPPPVGAARRRPPPNPCSVASGALRVDGRRWFRRVGSESFALLDLSSVNGRSLLRHCHCDFVCTRRPLLAFTRSQQSRRAPPTAHAPRQLALCIVIDG